MSETLVTDEIVKKAAKAFCCKSGVCAEDGPYDKCAAHTFIEDARAALSAVVDDLVRAEREAAARQAEAYAYNGATIAAAIRARG